jgi:hypothetical protein
MAEAFSARAVGAVLAVQGGHVRSGGGGHLVFRQRDKPVRHHATLPFQRGACAAMMLQIMRCLLILALAQVISMPLRGLNATIKQHFAPPWTIAAAQLRR